MEWLHQAALGTKRENHGGPTRIGRVVLALGTIPRGKGKAPESAQPTGLAVEDIGDRLNRVHQMANDLVDMMPQLQESPARMRHHVFGHLSTYQWVRLGHIHHRHHRKIVEDILKVPVIMSSKMPTVKWIT